LDPARRVPGEKTAIQNFALRYVPENERHPVLTVFEIDAEPIPAENAIGALAGRQERMIAPLMIQPGRSRDLLLAHPAGEDQTWIGAKVHPLRRLLRDLQKLHFEAAG